MVAKEVADLNRGDTLLTPIKSKVLPGDEGDDELQDIELNEFMHYIYFMEQVLSWQEIEKNYNQQWVQLVDYDWPEGEPRPKSGRVRLHASTRKEFNKLVLEAEPVNAARIYVGTHKMPEGIILSSNVVRITSCAP